MKKLLLMSLVAVGCGGNGVDSPSNEWFGSLSPGGRLNLAIVGGSISGSCDNAGEVGSVSGQLANSEITLHIDFPVSTDVEIQKDYVRVRPNAIFGDVAGRYLELARR